jgi:hypothetical protein
MAEAKRKVTMMLPATLVKRAKHLAVDQERDFQDVVQEALENLLRKGAAK